MPRTVKVKRRLSKRFILLLLVLLATALILWEVFSNRGDFARDAVIFSEVMHILSENGDFIDIYASDSGFFVTDANGGVSFYDINGERAFRHGHGIAGAVLFGSGYGAVVFAHGGRVLNYYNTYGLVYSVLIESAISHLAKSPCGFVALAARSDGGGYDIVAIDQNGQIRNLAHFVNDANAVAICPQAATIAAAFSEITDEGINSTIALISVATGEIFAKSLYNPEQTISQLSFMDGNRLLAISDTRIFAMNAANASEIWEEPLNMRISASAVTNAHLVITHAPSNVIVYDSTGGEILDMQKYTALTSIYLNFEHIILGTRGRFYGYNLRGENLWELQLPSGTDLRFMGNRNALVAKTPTSLRIFNGSN